MPFRLSLKSHPLSLLRNVFPKGFYKPISSFNDLNDGERVSVVGLVLVRQRPSTAKGIYLSLLKMIQVLQILLFGLVNLSVLNAPL